MAKAPNGSKMLSLVFADSEIFRDADALVQRPIIKLAQNNETNGAIASSFVPNFCFMNSGRLLAVETSTPTYKKMASIPKESCGYFKIESRLALSSLDFTVSILSGTEENLNITAASTNAAPKTKYGI